MIKYFKNSTHIKLDSNTLKEIEKTYNFKSKLLKQYRSFESDKKLIDNYNNYRDNESKIIIDICYNMDMLPICEFYCISNYDEACIFSVNGGYCYIELSHYDIFKLLSGETVKKQNESLNNYYIMEYLKD